MPTFLSALPLSAALAAPPPEPTQRSPLLYAWFALQAAAVIAVVWLLVRFARTSARRRRGTAERPADDAERGNR